MQKAAVSTVHDLNYALGCPLWWVNGKNYPVDHIHATGATSRWEYENIHGIYLTVPDYAWMALWMGATRRAKVKKRHLEYVRPDTKAGDHIGRLRVYVPEASEGPMDGEVFCEGGAYLYLTDPRHYADIKRLDLKAVPTAEKIKHLQQHGFSKRSVWRDSRRQENYFPAGPDPKMIVEVDPWQLALVNIPRIVPDIELFVQPGVVKELAERYASRLAQPPGEDYIVDK